MPKFHDISGMKFNRLTVLSRCENVGSKAQWHCLCECGEETKVTTCRLRNGSSKSCGCFRTEGISARAIKRNTVHGHNKAGTGNQSPEWNSWSSMKKRCLNPNNTNYPNYGGRGITICDRWMEFPAFFDDMGERPKGKTLDRIDVNGNYEPDNCRWATLSEQQRNKRCHSR